MCIRDSSWSEPKQAGNPYLALDDAPVPAMKVFAVPPELPDFAPDGDPYVLRGSVPSAADPAPTDSTRSFIPDFAQPTDDDIYLSLIHILARAVMAPVRVRGFMGGNLGSRQRCLAA